MVKVGVIGAGNMGRHHVRIYAGMEQCELIGVADPNPEKEQLASQYGAQFYTDYHGLLDAGPDLVTIAAPSGAHFPVGSDAIAAGCHLLVEKPITDSLDTAEELVRMAAEAGKTLAVGHIERFNPAVIELKKIVDSGELGELLIINNLRVGPYHGRIRDTGIVLDLGTHDVDLISYLFGARATNVFATAQRKVHNKEDHAVLQMAFPRGQTGIIETSWQAPYQARNIFIVGTEHFALCDLLNKMILVYEDNPSGGNLLAGLREVPPGDALENQLASVVSNVVEGTEPVCSGADSLYALKTCLAALTSIESGQATNVDHQA